MYGCHNWNACCRPVCCPCPCPCPPPSPIVLGGLVTGVGGPVANLPIMYTINGVSATTTTDALGRYSIIAPRGSQVIITPQVGLGVTVTPPSLSLPACENRDDLNFVLTPVTIP